MKITSSQGTQTPRSVESTKANSIAFANQIKGAISTTLAQSTQASASSPEFKQLAVEFAEGKLDDEAVGKKFVDIVIDQRKAELGKLTPYAKKEVSAVFTQDPQLMNSLKKALSSLSREESVRS